MYVTAKELREKADMSITGRIISEWEDAIVEAAEDGLYKKTFQRPEDVSNDLLEKVIDDAVNSGFDVVTTPKTITLCW